MTDPHPSELIGQRENQALEFKSAGALARPERVAREIVGMLNATPGTIWIGVVEAKDVAIALEPVDGAEAARQRLLDHCLDTIEPRPTAAELAISLVGTGAGDGQILKAEVRASLADRQPFAQLSGDSWRFHVRHHDRLRGLSRDEIGKRFRGAAPPDDAAQSAARMVRAKRDAFLAERRPGLWLGLRPFPSLDLRCDDPSIHRLLKDPAATGNRERGWNFTNRFAEVALDERGCSLGPSDAKQIAVQDDGYVALFVARDQLMRPGSSQELYSYCVLEHPVALMRLARALVTLSGAPAATVAADLAIAEVGGWTLRPYSPEHPSSHESPGRRPDDQPDILLLDPLTFSAAEVRDTPDRCGLALSRRIYRGFGLTDRHLPTAADLVSGTLSL